MTKTSTSSKKILKTLDQNRNFLIVGPGGTGKSTIIREFIAAHDDLNIIVCAPTGTAAVNIEGTTIHRAFGVPVPAYGQKLSKVPSATIKTLAAADVVIIDEISMCRNDVFSFAMRVLAKAEREKGSRIRLICCGDFYQLPPVVKKNELKLFKKFNLDSSGFPFTTSEWASKNFKVIELTDIYRQDEKEFVEHLNRIRDGNVLGLSYFDQFVNRPELETSDHKVYICGTNAEADKINNERLMALDSMPIAYQAECNGRVVDAPADKLIMLKEGERVIFTVNDVIHDLYQNGSMGTIVEVFNDSVHVLLDDGKNVRVYPHKWTIYTYKANNNELVKKELGDISQLPLKPAWAITIHKAQGKTFESAVIAPKTFAAGQLYVALSRVRNTQGLYLTEKLLPEYVLTSPEVSTFISNGYTWDVAKISSMVKKTTSKKKTSTKRKSSTTRRKSSTKKVKTIKRKTTAKRSSSKSKTTKTSRRKVTKKAKTTKTRKPKTSKLAQRRRKTTKKTTKK